MDDILGAPAEPKGQPQATVAVQNPAPSPKDKPATAADAVANINSQDSRPKPLSYVEMFEMMNPDKPETPEQKAEREKRERGEAVLAAVGDGISALSNLWFTSRYAPNSYDASKGLSATTRQRWDKLRQEREANRRAYYEGYVRARSMDEANERDDRNWRHTLEREKIADERYETQEARNKKQAELDEQLRRHQITSAEYQVEMNRIAAQYAESNEQLRQESMKADIAHKKAATQSALASANASNAKADNYENGGGNHGPSLQLEDDEPTRFNNNPDYERTVMRLAKEYNVPTTVEVNTGKMTGFGKDAKPVTRTAARTVKEIAADIEREAKRRKQAAKGSDTAGTGGKGAGYGGKGAGYGSK